MTPDRLAELLPILAPAHVGSASIATAVELAELEVALDHCFRDQVVVLMAAHKLLLGASGAQTGQVKSKTEGDLSITYETSGESVGAGLDGTGYGREALRLTRLCYGGITAMTRGFPYVPLA